MRRFAAALGLVIAATATSPALGSDSARPLRVVTLNLLHGGASSGLTGDTSFSFNAAYLSALRDRIYQNDVPFGTTFPYMASPHSGQYPAYAEVRPIFMPFMER